MEAFTHGSVYTEKSLHREAFTPRSFFTTKFLHREASEKPLHRGAFAHKGLHTEAATTQTLLHSHVLGSSTRNDVTD